MPFPCAECPYERPSNGCEHAAHVVGAVVEPETEVALLAAFDPAAEGVEESKITLSCFSVVESSVNPAPFSKWFDDDAPLLLSFGVNRRLRA